MPPVPRAPRLALLAVLGAVLAAAAPPPALPVLPRLALPPVDGQLSGRFVSAALPGAPAVEWRLGFSTPGPRRRDLRLEAQAPGLKAGLAARLDAEGDGTWSLDVAELDLGVWLPALVPLLPPDFAAVALSGAVTAAARGTVRAGRLAGTADVRLRGGGVVHAPLKARLEGVEADLVGIELGTWRIPEGQSLGWTRGTLDVVELGPGRVEFGLQWPDLRVKRGTLAVFGGELGVGDSSLALDRPGLRVAAEARALELARLTALLPPVVAQASGRVDGRLSMRRDTGGFQLGAGQLSLRQGETAEVRLLPTPGLLSDQLPQVLRRQYPGLVQLEAGGVPLVASELDIRLTPDGDAEGRSARVRLVGGPADPALTAPVVLEMNVRGPLDSLIRLGTHQRLRIGGPPR